MNDDHSSSDETIFSEALNLPSSEREQHVATQARDADQRERVMQLIAAAADSSFMDAPAPREVEELFARLKPEEEGDRIGNYNLLQQLGEGGFGTVWMADQEHPVRRRVALKIIKLGMDTKEVIARFEQERQALAMMDHPNIAKVFDAGATEYGRPYFVMELVRGVPITEYCDANSVGMGERLKLFVDVCNAVQHAHQKGIIHRDLKPSNILVSMHDGRPLPKVIDFGIAKATQQRLTDLTLFTRLECMVGTPLYMSPEQAEMSSLDVDTRSDIYSLGVLLYELLTGTTPFNSEELMRRGLDEVRRVIREEEPPRPSTALTNLARETVTALARSRRTDGGRLISALKGDLDWIVMRALEKDRTRRYPTANELAQDIQRHLTREPVQARPPSRLYRLQRVIQRNRGLVAAGASVGLALAIGAAVSIWQAVRLARERDAKDQAFRKASAAEYDTKAFGEFLVQRVLATARPKELDGGLGIDVTVDQALAEAEKHLDHDFSGRPLAEALARDAIGVTWESLGRYERATQHFRRALELRSRELGGDHAATLTSMNNLAVALGKSGKVKDALRLHHDTYRKRKATLGAEHVHTLVSLGNLGSAYRDAGDKENALRTCEKAVELSKRLLGDLHPETIKAMSNLARAFRDAGEPGKAVALCETAVRLSVAQLGERHGDTLTAMNNLAVAYEDAGAVERALPLYEQVVSGSRERLGPGHTETLATLANLAAAYEKLNAPEKATATYEELLTNAAAGAGAPSAMALTAMNNLAFLYGQAGRFKEARPLFERVLKQRMEELGPSDYRTVRSINNVALVLEKLGELAKAAEFYEQAYEQSRGWDGSRQAEAATIAANHARLSERRGNSESGAKVQPRTPVREASIGSPAPQSDR